ncbi:MAG: hypothetical protein GVY04_01355 [Cyanobacteria bacterium]|jgi:hypothetical protein|nr:hypothetical protein [Cyanobacteria bacterium GSL.Bin1]
MRKRNIQLSPSWFAVFLGTIAFILILASVTGQLIIYLNGIQDPLTLKFINLVNVDHEKNLPTYYSALLLLFSALLLAIITLLEKRPIYWRFLAVGFFYMAFDEVFSVHEELISPMRTLLGNDNLGIFYFAWVIPYFFLVSIVALILLKFWLRLPEQTKIAFLIAASIYLCGAMGIELIGGYFAETYGMTNLTYQIIVTIEESLEIIGVIVFIWALLVYIGERYQEVQFQFKRVHQNQIESWK